MEATKIAWFAPILGAVLGLTTGWLVGLTGYETAIVEVLLPVLLAGVGGVVVYIGVRKREFFPAIAGGTITFCILLLVSSNVPT